MAKRTLNGAMRMPVYDYSGSSKDYLSFGIDDWLATETKDTKNGEVSPILIRLVSGINNKISAEKRPKLVPFLSRVQGKTGDGKDDQRREIITEFLIKQVFNPWMDLAQIDSPEIIAVFTAAVREGSSFKLDPVTDALSDLSTYRLELLQSAVASASSPSLANNFPTVILDGLQPTALHALESAVPGFLHGMGKSLLMIAAINQIESNNAVEDFVNVLSTTKYFSPSENVYLAASPEIFQPIADLIGQQEDALFDLLNSVILD